MHVWPEYVADYLRAGFGNVQINRPITGSTGLLELTVEDIASIRVPLLNDVGEQKRASAELRAEEARHRNAASEATDILKKARAAFAIAHY